MEDYVHILAKLRQDISVSDVLRDIKSNCSGCLKSIALNTMNGICGTDGFPSPASRAWGSGTTFGPGATLVPRFTPGFNLSPATRAIGKHLVAEVAKVAEVAEVAEVAKKPRSQEAKKPRSQEAKKTVSVLRSAFECRLQRSEKVSQQLRLLRDHGLSKKPPRQRKYQLTQKGRELTPTLNALLTAPKHNNLWIWPHETSCFYSGSCRLRR